ncbi:MAG TPA: SDR family NAD(P)-dependent oxidoreductase, partial [Geminicoccaceae bacterium]
MPRPYQPGSPGHVLLTGASSGIGAALARLYAAPGVRLSLLGRDSARLAVVAEMCSTAGAEVATASIDVTAAEPLAAWLGRTDEARPVDLAIANAGISGASTGTATATQIIATNVFGVVNTVEPLIPRMVARGRGQLALMSSLAGFLGTAQAPAYCASKAAVRVWGEALGARLSPASVTVSVVCPGFVATPLTARNPFPMPLLMLPERAARIIARRLARGRARVAFPL